MAVPDMAQTNDALWIQFDPRLTPHVYVCPETTHQKLDDYSLSRIMDYEI